MKGIDKNDMTSWDSSEIHLLNALDGKVKGKKLCYVKEICDIENYPNASDELKEHLENFHKTLEIAKKLGITVEKVREVYKISQDPVSLETPIGEEDDSHLGDFIKDERTMGPEEYATVEMLKEELKGVLSTLTEREEKVLRLRFGLDDGQCRTLEEVGQIFGVTRERIRQIEAKALRKLRHPSRSRKLKDFLTD